MRLKISIALLATVFVFRAAAQQQQNVAVCTDKALHADLVSLDNALEQRGFKLVQFKTMNLPSGAYVPLTVSMEAGKMYQINFLANKNYNQFTFTLVDKDHKKLIDKKVKQKSGADHQLSESFSAPYTGEYIIILTQKVKGQTEACGGFSLLKAVNN